MSTPQAPVSVEPSQVIRQELLPVNPGHRAGPAVISGGTGNTTRDVSEARLIVPADSASERGADLAGLIAGVPWIAVIAAALALIGVVGAISYLGAVAVGSRLEWRDPSDAAFRSLCRRLGVSRPQRRILRESAKSLGCEPVAMLLSETVFERAMRTATPATLGPLEIVRRKLST